MGILIENIINDKKINDMSISESIINFTEECFSLEEYYNDIYNEQLILEYKELTEATVDNIEYELESYSSSSSDKTSSDKSSNNFFVKVKEFFKKMIAAIKEFISNTIDKIMINILYIKAVTNSVKANEATKFKSGIDSITLKTSNNRIVDRIVKIACNVESTEVRENDDVFNTEKYFKEITFNNFDSAVAFVILVIEKNINPLATVFPKLKKSLQKGLKIANHGLNSNNVNDVKLDKEKTSKITTMSRKLTSAAYSFLKNDYSSVNKFFKSIEK